MIVELILDKLGVFFDDPAKLKHGNSPELTYGDVVTRIVQDFGNNPGHILFPEIGSQTFNRMMRKCFAIKLNGGKETWFYHFLSIIEHKYCSGCTTIKHLLDFSKDKSNSSLGVSSICKVCRNATQKGQYQKYYDSHQKSYAIHYAEIKARQQLYKGERSLRVPSWYDKQKTAIETFYNKCPEGWHVDHIIPLKGNLVSGLHVLENLQYLSAEDNLQKGNKFTVE